MSQPPSTLAGAVSAFKAKMRENNHAFWTARIESLENGESLTPRERLRLFKYYCSGEWGPYGEVGPVNNEPREILLNPGEPGHVDMGVDGDGTKPPLKGEELDQLISQIRNSFSTAFPGVEMPEEYLELFTLVALVRDVWDAQTEIPGIDLFEPSGFQCSELDTVGAADGDGWKVMAHWAIGTSYDTENRLLLCQKEDSTNLEERELKWRVASWPPYQYEVIYFSSIAEWLKWRADWLERMPVGWQDDWPEPYYESDEDDEDEDENENED